MTAPRRSRRLNLLLILLLSAMGYAYAGPYLGWPGTDRLAAVVGAERTATLADGRQIVLPPGFTGDRFDERAASGCYSDKVSEADKQSQRRFYAERYMDTEFITIARTEQLQLVDLQTEEPTRLVWITVRELGTAFTGNSLKYTRSHEVKGVDDDNTLTHQVTLEYFPYHEPTKEECVFVPAVDGDERSPMIHYQRDGAELPPGETCRPHARPVIAKDGHTGGPAVIVKCDQPQAA